jgi:hypothetical protein
MESIPPELLTHIIEELYEESSWSLCCPSPLDKDPLLANLRNVRLVCSGFKAAAGKIFGETYFSSREVILEQSCLSTLLSIAKNKELRKYLKHLTVNTFQFAPELTQWSTFKDEVRSVRTNPHPSFLNKQGDSEALPFNGVDMLMAHSAFQLYYQTQKRMKSCGGFKAQLTECLMLLKSVRMFRHLTINGQDRAPVLRYVTKKIGLDKRYKSAESVTLVSDVVCTVIQALYWSRVKLCSFNLDCCGMDHFVLPSRYIVSKLGRVDIIQQDGKLIAPGFRNY